ncbi:DUF4405 domain-containing protein [Candidatus Oscillochloris fontis]|uniref:DUF4405 domain-containing protein n=1 Tax=Candidatus Oscillochloris fontis TaxID=2496868 RepID=UPI00101D8906|nr:DUF4405 domain-containing protein [Candidatus Oscillochloris fontis]
MKASPTTKWITDAILLVGYCVAVWLDLTGLELHQWLGVGVVLLAGYHMLTHMDWVSAVTRRLFSKTNPRVRLYYLINVLMLGSFAAIGITGILISTWLNLTLESMALLIAIHKWTAYLTLAVVGIKLALHWRWIVNVAGKLVATPAARQPATAEVVGRTYTRREVLKLMGVAALSSVAGVGVLGKALNALQMQDTEVASAAESLATSTATSAPAVPTAVPVVAAPASVASEVPVVAVPTEVPTAVPVVAAPTAVPVVAVPTAVPVVAAPVACRTCRRRKHCAYPGDCRDYVDTNGNGRCDLGECG